VSDYSVGIAKELELGDQEIADLKLSALLHDTGKIGIPDSILKKEGRLTDEEFDIMKTHPVRGIKIIQSVKQLARVFVGVRHHHERIDGRGYPDGLSGANIGLPARIIAVADTVDAMTTDRPYRKALSMETAKSELLKHSGTQFDPMVVQAFFAYIEQRSEQQNKLRQTQSA
jgi:HD-GYP domain-containing protein (c-di-GMP phosphodiesterase class II)